MLRLDSLFFVVVFLLLIAFVMVGVAFLTLLERSVFGYIHIRKRPNSVCFVGVFEPLSDAIKHFSKEQYFSLVSNYLSYYFSPVLEFFLSLLVWLLFTYLSGFICFDLGLLMFLCCSSLVVYTVMFAGWVSNYGYCLLGGSSCFSSG